MRHYNWSTWWLVWAIVPGIGALVLTWLWANNMVFQSCMAKASPAHWGARVGDIHLDMRDCWTESITWEPGGWSGVYGQSMDLWCCSQMVCSERIGSSNQSPWKEWAALCSLDKSLAESRDFISQSTKQNLDYEKTKYLPRIFILSYFTMNVESSKQNSNYIECRLNN